MPIMIGSIHRKILNEENLNKSQSSKKRKSSFFKRDNPGIRASSSSKIKKKSMRLMKGKLRGKGHHKSKTSKYKSLAKSSNAKKDEETFVKIRGGPKSTSKQKGKNKRL